ncbi:MAG: hypothetical protein JWN49_611 [Parcubacteria group bacterium]|nr:hypothetical protein [Parcubacteria group bacterium]
MDVLSALVIPLLLTLAAELAVAWCFGFRTSTQYFAITAINLITNPVLNFILLLYGYVTSSSMPFIGIALLEVIVVLPEYLLLTFSLPQLKKSRAFVFVLIANIASFALGLLVLGL